MVYIHLSQHAPEKLYAEYCLGNFSQIFPKRKRFEEARGAKMCEKINMEKSRLPEEKLRCF
jgi:hypothetical protein